MRTFRSTWIVLLLPMLLLGPVSADARGTKSASAGAVKAPVGKRAGGAAEAKTAKARPKPADEAAMKARLEKLGPLMDEIGVEAAMIAGRKSDGLFLYAEMDGERASLLLFRDRGKTVKGFIASQRLRELVEQAWALDPAGSHWAAMTMAVEGTAFDTHMIYPEEIDYKKPVSERVAALMPKRFAGKKIVVDRKPPREDARDWGEPAADGEEPVDLDEGKRWT